MMKWWPCVCRLIVLSPALSTRSSTRSPAATSIGRIAQGEREGAAVEQKDVRAALRDVVIAMHRPLDLRRVLVEGRYAMQPVVDILVDQRVLARIAFLTLRHGEVRDATGADDEMAEIVVRPLRLDDQHPGGPSGYAVVGVRRVVGRLRLHQGNERSLFISRNRAASRRRLLLPG